MSGPRQREAPQKAESRPRVWIDLDNAPHVPFFRPIVAALHERGCDVRLTARGDQTAALAGRLGLECRAVGAWRGGNLLTKTAATLLRAARLGRLPWLRTVDVAVSHGSRPMVLAAAARRIPVVTMYDYEGIATGLLHRFSDTLVVPERMTPPELPAGRGPRLVRYPGLKEEVYLAEFEPDPSTRSVLGVGPDEILILLRPESETAHYRPGPDSAILNAVLDRLAATEAVVVALLPRTADQEQRMRDALEWRGVRAIVPAPMDGRDLVWAADLVISGGGTMTREAAVLGVPAYSVFRGMVGSVDRYLAETGALVLIQSPADAERIRVERAGERDRAQIPSDNQLAWLLADEICAVGAA